MIVYKTFPLGGRCPSAHTGADEGYIPKTCDFPNFTPHQSKIKDFCQLLPREKLYAKQSFITSAQCKNQAQEDGPVPMFFAQRLNAFGTECVEPA